MVTDKAERLFHVDELINHSNQWNEEDWAKEYEKTEAYREKFIPCRSKVEAMESSGTGSVKLVNAFKQRKRNYKLPDLELPKFDGNIKNWLGFWTQIKKINEDEELDNGDKFHYVLQSMVQGSKARDFLQTFPVIGDNYRSVKLKPLYHKIAHCHWSFRSHFLRLSQ